jgi:hypothetical protein
MLRHEAHFAVIIRIYFEAHLCWLVCRARRVNGLLTKENGNSLPDAIYVRTLRLYTLFIPTLGPHIWMLNLLWSLPIAKIAYATRLLTYRPLA